MMKCLKRYWFEFDISGENLSQFGYLPMHGCGITAYDYNDALNIMRHFILRSDDLPKFTQIVENIDISTLEDKHIIPNLGVPIWRGVWFPAITYGKAFILKDKTTN